MTRTASDQFQSSLQSGSLAIDALISSSERLRSRSRSLLILVGRGRSRELTMVLFSFIPPCSPCSYYPTQFATKRTDENDFYVRKKTEDHVSRFAFAIGAAYKARPRKNLTCVVEIDPPFFENLFAFLRIPVEIPYIREQSFKLFRHSETSPGQ